MNTEKAKAVAVCLAFATSGVGMALAADFSVSLDSPTVDGADIAQLTQTDADWGTSVIWGDRPARGQTFMTDSYGGGYFLQSFSLRSARNEANNGTYFVRVGTVSGTTFTPVASESIVTTVDVAVDDWCTFTLGTPVTLLPDTRYGIDIGRSGSGWHSYRNTNDTSYAGGVAYSSGGSGVGGATISTHGHVRAFHIDLETPPPAGSLVLLR